MPTRYGYACINMTLAEQGVTTNRGCIKKTFLEKGLPHVSKLALQNCQDLVKILEWNRANGVQVFRMTSCLFPWHTEYEFEDLPDWNLIREMLKQAGEVSASHEGRLSFHPGQHVVLSSPRPEVVKSSVRDLRAHGEIMDAIGLPRTPEAKINIHVGGAYGEHKQALERWCSVWKTLPECVKSRITVENDDKPGMFSTKMLYEGVSLKTGVPVVFDSHHFECGPQDSTYEEAYFLAITSWEDIGVRPQCHHTNSRRDYEDPTAPRVAHSDWFYTPFKTLGKSVDVVLECKKKEIALKQFLETFSL